MNRKFQAYVERLPVLLNKLKSAPGLDRTELRGIPTQGVYVFYDGDQAIFAGRSDNLRSYLRSQGAERGDNFTASIAFGIAKGEAIASGYPFPTNSEALQDQRFTPFFVRAKERVANMKIRIVEVKRSD